MFEVLSVPVTALLHAQMGLPLLRPRSRYSEASCFSASMVQGVGRARGLSYEPVSLECVTLNVLMQALSRLSRGVA